MSAKKETALRQRIIKRLRIEKGGFWTHPHGGPFSQAGLPDIIGCYEGRFYAFELKLPIEDGGRELTQLQEYTLERIRSAGGVASLIRSYEDARKLLDDSSARSEKSAGERRKSRS